MLGGQHRQPPQHERQRLHRLAVGPLQVIDEYRRRAHGLLLSHNLEQPRAYRERRDGRAGPLRGDNRLGDPGGGPQQLTDDPEVQVGLGLVTASGQHPQPGRLGQAAPGQGRLAHPRVALDGHQPRLARPDQGDDLRDPGQLRRPAHENVERWLPVPHALTSLHSDE